MLIKHCFLIGKNAVQAKQWLKCYSDSALSETTVKKWFADFKCSCTDTNDAVMLRSPKKHQKTPQTRLVNRKLKLGEIAKKLKISEGNVFTILHEHFSMRKLCLKWVPHLLTVDQKQQHVNNSQHCFNTTKRSFCVNMWQWMKHGSTISNWQSAKWTAADESPKWPKTQTAGKILAFVVWDVQGILFIDYFEKGRTINSEYYIALRYVWREKLATKKIQPQIKKKKVLFHRDNTLCTKSIPMMAKLHELHFKLLWHPPYSPDLAPSDYWLFADLKRML